ncbi:MAG: hypothetical protein PHV20_04075 [Bacteroidales bacterium]|nr:hypothetical protein [Bacteroidales bacterium]
MEQNKELTIEAKVEEAFKGKRIDYERVFQNIYPAHGRNGFTERNQTFFFTHNYLKLRPEAICWQEVPFGKKEHIDTLIIDGNSVIYIEAKRISGNPKEKEIADDLGRLLIHSYRQEITKGLCCEKDEYILYITDIWDEGKYKKNVINKWVENYFLEVIYPQIERNPELHYSEIEEIKSGIFSFEKINNPTENAIKKYNIAYSLFKIKSDSYTNILCPKKLF